MLHSLLTITCLIGSAAVLGADPIHIGDAAPTLEGGRWLRGEAINQWEPGTVYVLDFWAGWCGPCISMMPLIEDKQREYDSQRVQYVGVGIWADRGGPGYEETLAKHEGLTYPVVVDDEANALAQRFMDAAMQSAMPTVMLIDREGRLAWIGEPAASDYEPAFGAVVNGSADLESYRSADQRRRDAEALWGEMAKALEVDQPTDALAIIDRIIALDPAQNGWAYVRKYEIAINKLDDQALAHSFAQQFLESDYAEKPIFNFSFATRHLTKIPKNKWDLELALQFAERAIRFADDDADYTYYQLLAQLHYQQKDLAKAVEAWERMMPLVPSSELEGAQETLEQLKGMLAEQEGDESESGGS